MHSVEWRFSFALIFIIDQTANDIWDQLPGWWGLMPSALDLASQLAEAVW